MNPNATTTERRNNEQQKRIDAGPVDVNAQVQAATTEHSAPTQSGDIVGNAPWPDEPRFVRKQRSWDEVPPEQP